MPSGSMPHGTEIAGWPVRSKILVIRVHSLGRGISFASSIVQGRDGTVGIASTSTPSRSRSAAPARASSRTLIDRA